MIALSRIPDRVAAFLRIGRLIRLFAGGKSGPFGLSGHSDASANSRCMSLSDLEVSRIKAQIAREPEPQHLEVIEVSRPIDLANDPSRQEDRAELH
jgi:hypothetical protein